MRTPTEAATSTQETKEALWRERVGDWRKSGESADKYSEGRGFAAGTLRWCTLAVPGVLFVWLATARLLLARGTISNDVSCPVQRIPVARQ
jgi:hypothetical protein